MKRVKCILCLMLCLIATPIFAESVTVEFENDLLYHTDKMYTHGTRITYEYNSLNWSLGQNVYTPTDISSDIPITNDRPYAGTLYVSLGGTKYNVLDMKDVFYQLEIAVGVVGKYSYANSTQNLIHRLTDSAPPNGWDYQTDNNLLIQTHFKFYGRMLSTTYISCGFYVFNDVGTVIADVGLGGNIMIGYNIPLILNKPITSKYSNFSIYTFVDGLEKHVFYNTLLDSKYTDITTVKFVRDIRSGVGLQYKNIELRYSCCVKTKEFKEQEDPVKFGSILFKFTY